MGTIDLIKTDTVMLDDEGDAVVIIDQTKLPGSVELLRLTTAQQMWDAIYLLQVRGAPAIGVAAAMGIYILAKGMPKENFTQFYAEYKSNQSFWILPDPQQSICRGR